MNVMRDESGDQAGELSSPADSVRRRMPVPSDCITQIDRLPLTTLSKAMWAPSGDQAGAASKASGRLLRRCLLPPSASMTATVGVLILSGDGRPGPGVAASLPPLPLLPPARASATTAPATTRVATAARTTAFLFVLRLISGTGTASACS